MAGGQGNHCHTTYPVLSHALPVVYICMRKKYQLHCGGTPFIFKFNSGVASLTMWSGSREGGGSTGLSLNVFKLIGLPNPGLRGKLTAPPPTPIVVVIPLLWRSLNALNGVKLA